MATAGVEPPHADSKSVAPVPPADGEFASCYIRVEQRLKTTRKAHTRFEPVLPPDSGIKPDSVSKSQIAPGSELNPHVRSVLERLKECDRERRR